MIPANNDMRFEVSTKCLYACSICPHATPAFTRKKEIMSDSLFCRLLDKIMQETRQYDTLTFPGMGEPLMDKGLEEKIKYAKSKYPHLTVLLLTNGAYLTPERFLRLQALGVASVRVSFYGYDARSYAQAHGVPEDMFCQVQKNLEEIANLRKGTQLLLTYNIIPGSDAQAIRRWVDMWTDRVDLLEVWRPHNWADFGEYRQVQSEKLKTCGRPFQGPLQVQVDGTVNMCCFDFNGKLTLGDLQRQSLAEIFSSPVFQKICGCHQSGRFEGSALICENCDQRNAKRDDVMVYNSRFDLQERVNMISTTYRKIISDGKREH